MAVWRLGKRPSNLNPSNLSAIYTCACAHIICTELPPNLNPPIFLFRLLGTKPPNLKIVNISGYTVYYRDIVICKYTCTHSARHFDVCNCKIRPSIAFVATSARYVFVLATEAKEIKALYIHINITYITSLHILIMLLGWSPLLQ